jgi:hypothetical protein
MCRRYSLPLVNESVPLPMLSVLEDGRRICDYCGVPNHPVERRSMRVVRRESGPCDTCIRGWHK